jgi:hypothetical protein
MSSPALIEDFDLPKIILDDPRSGNRWNCFRIWQETRAWSVSAIVSH